MPAGIPDALVPDAKLSIALKKTQLAALVENDERIAAAKELIWLEGQEKWLELNATFSAQWPNITRKKDSPSDADEHKGEEGKYDKYFSADPGEGD